MFKDYGTGFYRQRYATIEVCIKSIHQMNFQKKMYIYCKFFFLGMKKALLNGLYSGENEIYLQRGEYSNGKRRKREREI